jgi:UDP-N-acetylglucosamine acyltransferase
MKGPTADIDPTARIEPGAVIGAGVSVGPYCVVGSQVALADGCRLVAHVHVTGRTSIGPRTIVYPFASLGTPPQSKGYRGGATTLVIGADCDIRESVTMNVGSEDGGGVTTVGDRGFFMANSHVAHDCHVGNDVVFANCATLGGHCVVGDFAFIGGLSAAHQYSRIGAHAMVGGVSGVRSDVIPFGLVNGAVARLEGINLVGLKRRKFPAETISAIRAAYRTLFFGEGVFAARVDAVEAALGRNSAVAEIIAFIRAGRHRPLCQPPTYKISGLE